MAERERTWTPGGWYAIGARVYAHCTNPLDANDPICISVADADMDTRVEHDTTGVANAALMAAAPDLYEALHRLTMQCEAEFTVDGQWANTGQMVTLQAYKAARAALAKAEPQTLSPQAEVK